MMRVYWFRTRPNFGDALAPILLERFAGVGARWTHPALSDGVVIGSVAARLPHHYYGVVVGIGKFDESVSLDLSRAQVLGLRGELTLRGARARGNPVLGDSGLLAAELLGTRPSIIHPLGVVPHYKDSRIAALYPDGHVIDVGRDPIAVIREIASCERIVSSSLHGLITADAFDISRRWEPADVLRGGGFKFNDYASALGVGIEPHAWSTVPRSAIEAAVRGLRDAFREIPAALAAERLRPVHRLVQVGDSGRRWVVRQLTSSRPRLSSDQ